MQLLLARQMEVVLDWFLQDGVDKDRRKEHEIPADGSLEPLKASEAVQLLDKKIETLLKQDTYRYWLFVLARSANTEKPLTDDQVVQACNRHPMFDLDHPFVAELVQEFGKASTSASTVKNPHPVTDKHHFQLLSQYLELPSSEVKFERPSDRALPCWTHESSASWKVPKITHVLRWQRWVENAVKIGAKEAIEEVERFQDRPTFFVRQVGLSTLLGSYVMFLTFLTVMIIMHRQELSVAQKSPCSTSSSTVLDQGRGSKTRSTVEGPVAV